MYNLKKFSIIGSGSWGTAIAVFLAKMNYFTTIYSKSGKIVNEINSKKTNSKYLSSVKLPGNLVATAKLIEVVDSDIVFIAVPSNAFSDLLKELKKICVPLSTVFIIATKGISSNPVEMLSDSFRRHFPNPFAFFSGPCLAKEVALGKFGSATISSQDLNLAKRLALSLSSTNFQISSIQDIITVQISSIVKNIIAIKSGILEATKAGENEKAWLITKALKEIVYISTALGGESETIFEPAVIGDLVLTSYSKKSRNTRFGFKLHHNNYSKSFISSYVPLVEGVEAIKLIRPFLLKYRINLTEIPVINSMVEIIKL